MEEVDEFIATRDADERIKDLEFDEMCVGDDIRCMARTIVRLITAFLPKWVHYYDGDGFASIMSDEELQLTKFTAAFEFSAALGRIALKDF